MVLCGFASIVLDRRKHIINIEMFVANRLATHLIYFQYTAGVFSHLGGFELACFIDRQIGSS